MTDKLIFKKAIEKAVKNSQGFGFGLALGKYEVESRLGYLDGKKQEEPYVIQRLGDTFEREIAYQVIIFRHDFAKAFWGEEHNWQPEGNWNLECKNCGRYVARGAATDNPECWKYSLQQMVLEENPIRYMGRVVE